MDINACFNVHKFKKERTTRTSFKKTTQFKIISLSIILIVGLLLLAGCGSSSQSSSSSSSSSSAQQEDKTIVVAASPTPHAEILREAVAPILEKEGYKLEVKEFKDYVLPNKATVEGEVDANYFQHVPHLDNFNSKYNTNLTNVALVHIEPMKIYADKTLSLDAIQNGARVAIPNDPVNEARALNLLQDAKLITLDPKSDVTASIENIIKNPYNLNFVEAEASSIPDLLPEVDIATVNTNYALSANLPKDKVLLIESSNSPYVNVLVCKVENRHTDKIQALIRAINSPAIDKFINNKYNGGVIPAR